MYPTLPSPSNDEEYLGLLAMQFRGTRDAQQRKNIAKEYCVTVKHLIRHGWKEMPPPEDQLPDEFMPGEFFNFWLGRSP